MRSASTPSGRSEATGGGGTVAFGPITTWYSMSNDGPFVLAPEPEVYVPPPDSGSSKPIEAPQPSVMAAFLGGFKTGTKAVYNAGADTVWGMATAGNLITWGQDHNPMEWEVDPATDIGYDTSYMLARPAAEFLGGFGLGKLVTCPGKIGKLAFAVDMSGNLGGVAGGVKDAIQNGGITRDNFIQMAGGLAGSVGGLGGYNPKCFVAGTQVVIQITPNTAPPEFVLSPIPDAAPIADESSSQSPALAFAAAGLGLAAVRRFRQRNRRRTGD